MENEKRKVGDYTVLCAVNIGSREIILAENEQDLSLIHISALGMSVKSNSPLASCWMTPSIP